jgi:hypothetical protein
MSDLLPVAIAAVFVLAIVLLIARKFKISSRYERAPPSAQLLVST